MTYNLDELILGVILGSETAADSNDMREVEYTPEELLGDAESPVRVNEFSSTFGRCYEVTTLFPFKSAEYVTIVFNMTLLKSRRMAVYIYEHGEIGLLSNYWVSETFHSHNTNCKRAP